MPYQIMVGDGESDNGAPKRDALVWTYGDSGIAHHYVLLLVGYLIGFLAALAVLIVVTIYMTAHGDLATKSGQWASGLLIILVVSAISCGGVVVGQRLSSMRSFFIKMPDGRFYLADLRNMHLRTERDGSVSLVSGYRSARSIGMLVSDYHLIGYAEERRVPENLAARDVIGRFACRIARVEHIGGGLFACRVRCEFRTIDDDNTAFRSSFIISKSYQDFDGVMAELRGLMSTQVFS